MARRPNYGAEKRQKEIQKQRKKDEKAEKKRLRKESPGLDDPQDLEEGDLEDESPDGGAEGPDPEPGS